jgi:hypothetical protein
MKKVIVAATHMTINRKSTLRTKNLILMLTRPHTPGDQLHTDSIYNMQLVTLA